jgi:hypothetical protein
MDLSLPPPVPGDSVECRYFTFRRVEAGRMSADVRRRVVYDALMDSLMVVEPSSTIELPNPAFEVVLP